MAVSLLRRLAATTPAPVFAVAGEDGARAVEPLRLDPAVTLTDSPRHAALLVIAGPLRRDDHDALARLHDQLPHPRATVWWGCPPLFPGIEIPSTEDAAPRLAEVYRAVTTGSRASDADLRPDEPPAPWRGKGDHGQGGEGMMGGTPYGRPMAMTADDLRDGLALDAYTATFGPFLPVFPPGLVLEMTLQGDVIQHAAQIRPPYPQHGTGLAACQRRVARLLRLLGLPARAEAVLRDAAALAGVPRSGALAALPPGLGLRERLRAWCAGEMPPPRDDTVERLPGLEWSEAVLLLTAEAPL